MSNRGGYKGWALPISFKLCTDHNVLIVSKVNQFKSSDYTINWMWVKNWTGHLLYTMKKLIELAGQNC